MAPRRVLRNDAFHSTENSEESGILRKWLMMRDLEKSSKTRIFPLTILAYLLILASYGTYGTVGMVQTQSRKQKLGKRKWGKSRCKRTPPDFCFLLSQFLLFPRHSSTAFAAPRERRPTGGPPTPFKLRWIEVD